MISSLHKVYILIRFMIQYICDIYMNSIKKILLIIEPTLRIFFKKKFFFIMFHDDDLL